MSAEDSAGKDLYQQILELREQRDGIMSEVTALDELIDELSNNLIEAIGWRQRRPRDHHGPNPGSFRASVANFVISREMTSINEVMKRFRVRRNVAATALAALTKENLIDRVGWGVYGPPGSEPLFSNDDGAVQ